MNKARRKRIEKVVNLLEELRDELESVKDEEQTAYDNMPESLRESERGESMQEAVDTLDDINTDFENLIENVNGLL